MPCWAASLVADIHHPQIATAMIALVIASQSRCTLLLALI